MKKIFTIAIFTIFFLFISAKKSSAYIGQCCRIGHNEDCNGASGVTETCTNSNAPHCADNSPFLYSCETAVEACNPSGTPCSPEAASLCCTGCSLTEYGYFCGGDLPDSLKTEVEPFKPDLCDSKRCIAYDELTGDCIDYSKDPGIKTGLGCIPYDPFEFIRTFRGILISIASGISLILMIVGAFYTITSKGNQDQIQRGKEIFTSALIGLLMLISSVFLLRLISVDLLDIL